MPERVVARSAVARWTVATVLLGGFVFVFAMVYGDAAPQDAPSSIADPGLVTGWGLPVSRVIADLAGFVTIGFLLAVAFLMPAPAATAQGLAAQAVRNASWAATVWACVVAVELVFTISDLFFTPVWGLRLAESTSFMFDTAEGRALVAQIVMAAAVAVLSRWVLGIGSVTFVLVLAVLSVTPPALTGHSASSGSHMLAVASLLLHIVGASLWVGGLVALGWVATRGSKRLPAAVGRFSVVATWCIAVVALSGVVNASVRVERLSQLFTTGYGNLVLAKAAAIGALGAFGLMQRRRAIPRLRSDGAGRVFVGLAAVEILVMSATVALAVALSRTPPPVPADLYTDPVT
ncbi:MAG: copper resistance D family protein, partial [Nocardioidaceae bacterium]